MDSAPKNSGRNRRSAARRPPRGTVRVECRKGSCGMGANLTQSFLDISEGGVRIVTTEGFEPKEEVEVQISTFSYQKPVKRLANVAWVLPLEGGAFCIGLAFQKRLSYAEVMQFSRP